MEPSEPAEPGAQAASPEAPGLAYPEWLESTLNITAGRDPLGFQTITTDRIIPRLVPGVLALSRRARYLSFYAFVLAYYREQELPASNNSLSEFLKQREFELSLAIQLCPAGCGTKPVSSVGRERAGPLVRRGLASFPRGESVQSYLGGYGLYYRSPMIDLGLVAPRGTPFKGDDTATKVDVLWPDEPRGEALARAFDEATRDTRYRRRYFTSTDEIPRDVLVEYATVACLCRLPEYPVEQELLRTVLFDDASGLPDDDVARRREAFALLLWMAQSEERVVRDDAAYRRGIWDAHEHHRGRSSASFAATTARWSALVGKEFMQEGVASIWSATCRTGLAAMRDGPIASADVDARLVAPLVSSATLQPFGTPIAVEPQMRTVDFARAITEATAAQPLEDVRAWAIDEGSAVGGLALLFAVASRVRSLGEPAPGWNEVALQDGEHQPSLSRLLSWLDDHLATDPTLETTMGWLVRTLVLWPHEAIAYGKLPESTFRFRRELGRLRFYDLAPERFGLAEIRRDPLGRLAADVGFLDWTDAGGVPTELGRAFVAEVFE